MANNFDGSAIFRQMLTDMHNARKNRKPRPDDLVMVPSSKPGYVEFVRRNMIIDAEVIPDRKELEQ